MPLEETFFLADGRDLTVRWVNGPPYLSVTETKASVARREAASVHPADKPKLTGLFRDNPKTPEGKYLVLRRDGTVPPWPSFVLGGADPHAAVALRAYADSIANDPDADTEFVARLRQWADEMDGWRKDHGPGDPTRGQHRKDVPWVVEMMRQGLSA
jgi:hypothetical protein